MNSSGSPDTATPPSSAPAGDPWRRKRKTYVSHKPTQIRLIGQVATILLLGAIMALGNLHVFQQLSTVFETSAAPDDVGTRLMVGIYGALSVAVSVAIIFIVSLFYSHRVAGPASKLCRHLAQIRDHGAPDDVGLRNSDLLTELAAEINRTQRHWRKSADAALEAVAELKRCKGPVDERTVAARCRTIELALESFRRQETTR